MSLSTPDASQLENKDTKPAVKSNYDNETTTTAETKRKPSAMTRRMSFSMTRPWSSYAENYSSCLSSLRRNSSEQLIKRQGSFQSSPTSSTTDLSKSLDSERLKNLKADTSDSNRKPRTVRISAMHARPFHQRRWSSPVAFSVTKLASSSKQASKQLEDGNRSEDTLQDYNEDKKRDKICETDEIILSQEQVKTPVCIAQLRTVSKTENKVCETISSDEDNFKSGKRTSQHLEKVCNNEERKEDSLMESDKMDENQTTYTKDDGGSDLTLLKSSSTDKLEDPVQNRNIYTEIKKNTKWSKSKSFRRRHHTIHADSRRFLPPTLFTIAEQSSGSFGSVSSSGEWGRSNQIVNGKLKSRRSKSLDDINTLSDDMKINGVCVQQLCAKSFCVSVASSKNKKETASKPVTTVAYRGEDKFESTSERPTSSCPVQVNIQTFSKIQITPGVAEKQQKPQVSKIQQPYFSTQQHAVFTQPKAKWASITISQV